MTKKIKDKAEKDSAVFIKDANATLSVSNRSSFDSHLYCALGFA